MLWKTDGKTFGFYTLYLEKHKIYRKNDGNGHGNTISQKGG